MKKKNKNNKNRHPELVSGSKDYRFRNKFGMTMGSESGRTLLELLMTLVLISLLGIVVIKLYNHFVNKVKVQNTAKMIKTLVLERQNLSATSKAGGRTRVKGPHSDLFVENGVPGNHSKYFLVETTLSDADFCESLKNRG